MRVIYLDNNATTAVAPEVVEAMLPYLGEQYFNPSSMYDAARGPAAAIRSARAALARLLHCRPDEVLFTSCATESNNTAIIGATRARPQRRHIITSAVEHPAVLEVCKFLVRQGYEVDFLPVHSNGTLDTKAFVRALRPGETLLVSLMHANNETGVLFPIGELARIAKETDPAIVVHTDATQTAGKLPLNLEGELKHVDLLSLSGHKLHAPKGVGALFVRRGTPIRPFLLGGHQEGSRRGGTENVPYIVGLARALELAMATQAADERRVTALRNRLERELAARIPYLEVNGAGAPRLDNTLNVAVHFVEGEGMLYQLAARGICASSGSACTSGSLEPSHVLRAMRVPFTAVHGSLRFSLSRYSTDDDVDAVITALPEVIANLRRLSPYWDESTQAPRPEGEALLRQAVEERRRQLARPPVTTN